MKHLFVAALVFIPVSAAHAAEARLKSLDVVEPGSLRSSVQALLEAAMPKLARCIPSEAPSGLAGNTVQVRVEQSSGSTSTNAFGDAIDGTCFTVTMGEVRLPNELTSLHYTLTFDVTSDEIAEARAQHPREVSRFCATFGEQLAKAKRGETLPSENLVVDAALSAGYESSTITFATRDWLESIVHVNPGDVYGIFKGGASKAGVDSNCPELQRYCDDYRAGKTFPVKVGGATSTPSSSGKSKKASKKKTTSSP